MPPTDPTAALRTAVLGIRDWASAVESEAQNDRAAAPYAHFRALLDAALASQANDPSVGHVVTSHRSRPVTISEADFGPVHGAQADDPSGPDVESAWEALLAAVSMVAGFYSTPDGVEAMRREFAFHRPIIEAAIRAESGVRGGDDDPDQYAP